MRLLALSLLVCLLATAGCKSRRDPGPERDYRSINDTSRAFLKETLDNGRALNRRDLKEFFGTFQVRKGREKLMQRESLLFLGETLGKLERGNTRLAGEKLADEAKGKGTDFWASVRFGFLDSGK